MPVLPKVIPGRLHPDNRGSIDWGYGLVAYGCHSYVVVVAPSSLEVVQVCYFVGGASQLFVVLICSDVR